MFVHVCVVCVFHNFVFLFLQDSCFPFPSDLCFSFSSDFKIGESLILQPEYYVEAPNMDHRDIAVIHQTINQH